jgi:hypothetical protein
MDFGQILAASLSPGIPIVFEFAFIYYLDQKTRERATQALETAARENFVKMVMLES